MSLSGRIFDIQKFSIHDGPGIRTTVFVKGCPLRCAWCHNPESQSSRPQLSFNPDRCIGCGYCYQHCTHGGHHLDNGVHTLDRAVCVGCGECTEGCYAKGLEMIGREASVDDIIDDVLRDRPFYETSGGGMTVSGGEPLLQPEFTLALLQRAKAERLHTCLETSGFGPWERLQALAPFVDLFLYDLKETDDARHRELTGVSNASILDNLQRLYDQHAAIRLRLPMVPGVNDSPEHFAEVARLAARLPHLQGVEIMPYHKLGEGKLERLGLQEMPRITAEAPTPAEVAVWIERFAQLGLSLLNEPPL